MPIPPSAPSQAPARQSLATRPSQPNGLHRTRATARPAAACGLLLGGALLLGAAGTATAQNTPAAERRAGDYIVAIVNQELVTNAEVQLRLTRLLDDSRSKSPPSRDELQRQLLDQLIDERAQLSYARETGSRIDEAELDRAVGNVAAQNQLSVAQLRERLLGEGMDYGRFRSNLRDQMLLERVREREVQSRLRVSDTEIENWLSAERDKAGLSSEFNIAQILIGVPDGASAALLAERRAVAVRALTRLRAGESFEALVRELSQGSKEKGGELGLRAAARLPDVFVEAIKPLKAGEVAPQVLRTGAGFHVLKLVERKDASLSITQHRARHILLRLTPELNADTASRRLAQYRRDVEAGKARFEDLARRFSDDASAAAGGDLGWAGPGQFVPEFEQALVELQPGGISAPVASRFGIHLIQLVERRSVKLDAREQREAARSALREQKYDEAYADWAREVRARAYVELREPPQ
jgi:peptidyl-prolyl cis-trans isomerase SurA